MNPGRRPVEQRADQLRGVGADRLDHVQRVDAVGGRGPAGRVVPGEGGRSHPLGGHRGRVAAATEHLDVRPGDEQLRQRDAGLAADPGHQDVRSLSYRTRHCCPLQLLE
ncbi:hypothetical protein A7K94_0200710 [Modestobacter sp. VKM Ac-2676]|nr:hypothetical protein A7K94_0200710 [Modestobacter sp. VKM Ac-2676]